MTLSCATTPGQSWSRINGWFCFDGISTIVGYLMLNPFLYLKTVLFHTIQFGIIIDFCLLTVKWQNIFISTKFRLA